MKKNRIVALFLLFGAALALVATVCLWPRQSGTVPSPSPVLPAANPPVADSPAITAEPPLPEEDVPQDALIITVERQQYASNDLQLLIPKLGVDVPVLNGTDLATLKKGVGLYDYAQLPGEGDRNVAIAGHRNGRKNGKVTDDKPFYYLDTLEAGDCLYLRDQNFIYQYIWDSVEIVEPDDWGPIYRQGFSCLTLTSCEPIGISDHRIIVRGRLAATFPREAGYPYPPRLEEAVK